MTDFFTKFKKEREKISGVKTDSSPPEYWLSTGSHLVNKVISGSYDRGLASSRLTMITGPSDAGKSLFGISAAVQAQKKGYGVIIIDSEHALDDDYMEAVGLDVNNEYFLYNDVNSLTAAKKVIFSFTKTYRENKDKLPPFYLFIDSLDQLRVDAHEAKASKGEIYSDQGLQAKMHKQFSSDIAHEIRDLNIFGAVTKQPYENQDPISSKRHPWIITSGVRFPFSQILLVTNVWLKDDTTKNFEGIKVTAFAEKTRFCKPHQKCVVEIGYDAGIDPYSGILDAASSIGVVEKNHSWYTFEGKKFQSNELDDELKEAIYQKLVEKDDDKNIVFDIPLGEGEVEDHQLGGKTPRKKKTTKKKVSKSDG